MHDKGKVIGVLLVFVVFVTFPIWYGATQPFEAPAAPTVAGGKTCIESTEFMRTEHMVLLDNWRDSVVREGDRWYTATDGKKHKKSLTTTCLGACHGTHVQFCDGCHEKAGVAADCWTCHLDGKGR